MDAVLLDDVLKHAPQLLKPCQHEGVIIKGSGIVPP
jgi:hypothetical protein